MIDIDYENTPSIAISQRNTEDVRDRLVSLFINKAVPKDIFLDGFARISRLEVLDNGTVKAEIIPIHPLDMPKYIDHIQKNAAEFKLITKVE